MRVVHVTEAFEGGVIEFLRQLINHTKDIQHTVIYGRHHFFETAKPFFPATVKFIAWNKIVTNISPLKDLHALYNLIKILKAQQPFDVLHLHSAKANVSGRLAAKIIGHKKIIYTPHSAPFLRKDVSVFMRRFFVLIEKTMAVIPATVVGVCQSEATAYHNIGIKATYVNNGKSFPQHQPEKKDTGTFNIVTTGRAATQKNPAAFNRIALAFANNPQVHFIWIGDGLQRNLLTSPNIKITGWITHVETEKYLSEAQLYISTALWEGLPYAVLEAMSFQLPLLLSGCAGNTDLVVHDVNGFLYDDVQEAVQFIHQYLKNKEWLVKHGEASLNILRTNFNLEQMAEGYIHIYNTV